MTDATKELGQVHSTGFVGGIEVPEWVHEVGLIQDARQLIALLWPRSSKDVSNRNQIASCGLDLAGGLVDVRAQRIHFSRR